MRNPRQVALLAILGLTALVGGPFWAYRNHEQNRARLIYQSALAMEILKDRSFWQSLQAELILDPVRQDEPPPAGSPVTSSQVSAEDAERVKALREWSTLSDSERSMLVSAYYAYWRLGDAERAQLRAKLGDKSQSP